MFQTYISPSPLEPNAMTARKTKVDRFLTSKENIALDLAFEWLGESRVNRTMEEYREIASRIPNLTELRKLVNKRLRQIAKKGEAPYEICYFKGGDYGHWYEKFPTSLSLETVRKAWVKSGMAELKAEHRKMKRHNKNS
jgi:hypothetical protein